MRRRKPEDDVAERVTAELHAQGLSLAIQDQDAIRQVVALLGDEDARRREQRLAEIQRELAGMELRVQLDEELSDTTEDAP